MGVGYNQAPYGQAMNQFDTLILERRGAVGLVTINRPQVLNALSIQTIDDLDRAVSSLRSDAGVRALVITGAGEKAFVAGADISELATLGGAEAEAYALRGQRVFERIEQLGRPVIAAVNGFALGGGCELAMACTIRIAAEGARFGQPEIRLGTLPGFGGTQRLARLVGAGRALDLLLSGRMIDAEEALRIGLVTRVVSAATLQADAFALAEQLAALPPLAARYVIAAVLGGAGRPMADGARLEAALFGLAASTEDMHEGTQAFLEKRPPAFKGR